MTTPLEISFKAKLRNIARETRVDPHQLWQNIVLERFLVRLFQSKYRQQFILKGGVLLASYLDLKRHTEDLDFLLTGIDGSPERLKEVLNEILAIPLDDGFAFRDLTMRTLDHPEVKIPVVRAQMWSNFGRTRFRVCIDFGQGDLVDPITRPFPLTTSKKGALFESSIEVTCYPLEFIFAEKLEAIIRRGAGNSRMKDFHDLHLITQTGQVQGDQVEQVARAVFRHRDTDLRLPISFSSVSMDQFEKLWQAHSRALSSSHGLPDRFEAVLDQINGWLGVNTQLG